MVGRYGAPRIHLSPDGDGNGAGAGGAGGGQGEGAAGAGSGTGADAATGAAGAGATGGQSGGDGGATSPYRPDGLPDHLWGKTNEETIDKLAAANAGFRKQQGDAGAVPENADGYKFEASDKLKPYVSNFDKDPVFAKTREVFHAAGITDKQFNAALGPLLESLIDGGLVAAPIDAKAQLRALAPPDAANLSDADKEVAGGRRVTDNIAWADGAKANKSIPDDIADYLAAGAADSPAANKLIEWLRSGNSEIRPAMGGASGAGMTADAMKARINDPRNFPDKPEFDRAFARETDELSRKHYG